MVGEEYHPTKLRLVGLQEQEGEDRTPGALQERLSWLMELCNCQVTISFSSTLPTLRDDSKCAEFIKLSVPAGRLTAIDLMFFRSLS